MQHTYGSCRSAYPAGLGGGSNGGRRSEGFLSGYILHADLGHTRYAARGADRRGPGTASSVFSSRKNDR